MADKQHYVPNKDDGYVDEFHFHDEERSKYPGFYKEKKKKPLFTKFMILILDLCLIGVAFSSIKCLQERMEPKNSSVKLIDKQFSNSVTQKGFIYTLKKVIDEDENLEIKFSIKRKNGDAFSLTDSKQLKVKVVFDKSSKEINLNSPESDITMIAFVYWKKLSLTNLEKLKYLEIKYPLKNQNDIFIKLDK